MKRLIIAAALALNAFCAGAQTEFGIRAGFNGANLLHQNFETANIQGTFSNIIGPAVYAGVFSNVYLSDRFGLRVGVDYINNTSKYNSDFRDLTGWKFASINTLAVPLMARFITAGEKLSIMLGPQFEYNLSVSTKQDNGEMLNWEKEEYYGFGFGMGIGADYRFNDNFGMEFRYNLSLTDLEKEFNTAPGVTTHKGGRTSNIQVGVYYAF